MQGDKKIIDILNHLLTGELSASDQYLIHGETVSDLGLPQLAAHMLHESEHEHLHAKLIIQRILFLEGTPNVAKRNDLNIGKNVKAMLENDLALEYSVVKHLKVAIQACEKAEDFVSRDMLVKQLDDTEMDHAYWIEKQLKLIQLVGLENYQQSQMQEAPAV
ncbi:MAG: bacterioferritin [Methylophilaceae bacterium]|nr:MAG: bacterioferritin [Methylophilaceae bacterium]